jgi:hypothetical protein
MAVSLAQPSITFTLPKRDHDRLQHLALRYGLSLADFSQRILRELSQEIPEESFDDYERPDELRASFARALDDWQAGRVRDRV